MRLFLLLVAVPIIEIALFIEIGGWLGTWTTVGIVILTALIGSILLRQQGLAALQSVQSRLAAGENPGRLLADGAMILIAGALLLTPGFFTDAVGFALLIPPVRTALWGMMASRMNVVHVQMGGQMGDQGPRRPGGSADGDTVDGVYEDITPGEGPEPGQGADRDDPPPLRRP